MFIVYKIYSEEFEANITTTLGICNTYEIALEVVKKYILHRLTKRKIHRNYYRTYKECKRAKKAFTTEIEMISLVSSLEEIDNIWKNSFAHERNNYFEIREVNLITDISQFTPSQFDQE